MPVYRAAVTKGARATVIGGQSFGGPGLAFSAFIGACGRPVIM